MKPLFIITLDEYKKYSLNKIELRILVCKRGREICEKIKCPHHHQHHVNSFIFLTESKKLKLHNTFYILTTLNITLMIMCNTFDDETLMLSSDNSHSFHLFIYVYKIR